ncbi:nucleotide-binding domain-containing protein [Rosenbergiella epipactidis]|uniref:nucleotide-binding domain-containing protein n=1 Tax=Rosenbergiella epipactidis TaxID=1544694 RepID=UPI001F4DFF6C|nr:nucleotidyltransferase [Rosenbergiella epipactidis]
MSQDEVFGGLLENLKIDIKQAQKISYHYRKITRALNLAIRGQKSSIANRLKVGSIGRHTGIKGISDLDMLYIMPDCHYSKYNSLQNGQSKLLTDVKDILSKEYPAQVVKVDRLVVQVVFKHFHVEVQPVFKLDDGSFKYPESYYGGSWKITKPSQEIKAMTIFSRDKSKNLRKLCKMVRAWKNFHGVNMGGLLIDTLAHKFLTSTSEYDNTGNYKLGYLIRDFFEFLSNEERRTRYHALGSGQHVNVKSPWFGRYATKALELCNDAIEAEGMASMNDKWRLIFGRSFPKRSTPILESRSGMQSMALDHKTWNDTEEFIEDRYPVDIREHVELDCKVTQDGFRTFNLSEMLPSRYRLSPKKSLNFEINLSKISIEQPYNIYWKVLNVGEEARKRNQIRGQIVSDDGFGTKKESTSFSGDHIVECYIVKNNVVVGRAQIAVPIS